MPEMNGFLVEDFIQSITTQLDRVQDVLRLKALTRPLTYALKDFALDLNVFVEMDGEGNIRFRTSGPNESGASVVRLGFTTITKPMIEENTMSLSLTQSPTLGELGLGHEERRRLEHLGIRNAAQLQQLRQSTGTTTISRYTGVPVTRLREALQQGLPFVREVKPEKQSPIVVQEPPKPQPPSRLPDKTTPTRPRLPLTRLPGQPPTAKQPPAVGTPATPVSPTPPTPGTPPRINVPIHVTPDIQRLRLSGGNLLNPAGPPTVRLAGQPLEIDLVDDDEILVQLPSQHQGGALEIELPHGQTLAYDLSVDDPETFAAEADLTDLLADPNDPWSPQGGEA